MYSKLANCESRISELEEMLKEALDNEKAMRYQLEDVEYSEVGVLKTDQLFVYYQ